MKHKHRHVFPLCLLALALPGAALAQDAQTSQIPAGPTAPTPTTEEPSSTEQGQTPMGDSFGPMTHDEWVRETRRKAFEDTVWNVQLRTFYLTRDRYDDTEAEAWAIAGSLGFKTGYFRERVAFGATLYTSQKLYGPEDKDGTLLLATNQEGYTMLGEAYGEVLFGEEVKMTVGARTFDTPYLNKNDSRMTPNTFTAVAFQGLHGQGTDESPEWRWGAGYFDDIKPRNENQFISMAQAAGVDEERGVLAAGLNYKRGEFQIGAIDYYSGDIINIFYTEAKYAIPLSAGAKLRLAAQYSDQRNAGDDLLTGGDFEAYQWGAKAELAVGAVLLTGAFTSADGDANMRNPWSGYPGYTSVQVEDFNRDGEEAWMIRAGYDSPQVKGLSLYALYVAGNGTDSGAPGRGETDFNVQWTPPEGPLKGLMVRVRYAHVSQNDFGDTDLNDLRVMVYYDLPL